MHGEIPLTQVFDNTSAKFAGDIDGAIEAGRYLRGELFVELTKRTVKPGGHILDYGCGPGRLALLLAQAGFSVRGVDTSQGMIAQANLQDAEGLDVRFALIESPDDVLAHASYDAVVCSSVIEYVPDPESLLTGFHRTLRDAGILIISYANASSVWRRHWARDGVSNPMSVDDHHVWDWLSFRTLLARHAFTPIMKPQFFESPLDRTPFDSLVRLVPFIGSLGLVAAQRGPGPTGRASNE